jgi:hypothetical protein
VVNVLSSEGGNLFLTEPGRRGEPQHPPKRLAVAIDASPGRSFALGKLKALTGGDPVSVRGWS